MDPRDDGSEYGRATGERPQSSFADRPTLVDNARSTPPQGLRRANLRAPATAGKGGSWLTQEAGLPALERWPNGSTPPEGVRGQDWRRSLALCELPAKVTSKTG
jgi:hypothetical protein